VDTSHLEGPQGAAPKVASVKNLASQRGGNAGEKTRGGTDRKPPTSEEMNSRRRENEKTGDRKAPDYTKKRVRRSEFKTKRRLRELWEKTTTADGGNLNEERI